VPESRHLNAVDEPAWVAGLVKAEPRAPLMLPYMAYLALMMLTDLFPATGILSHVAIAMHIVGAVWAIRLMRRHWPPLGRNHAFIALGVGLFAAWMWVAGQHWLEGFTLGGQNLGGVLSLGSEWPFVTLVPLDPVDVRNVAADFAGGGFWVHVVLKIARAVTVVPIVEELFWRGFILRAFVSWDRFETVPLGKFTLFSFLASSLLSVIQHPANCGVSILCWMLFNGLFYWSKSLRCLMLTHGVTNLALYIYVVKTGDWQFW